MSKIIPPTTGKLVDPYNEFRIFLMPVRCTMGGGPGGCQHVIGRYQTKVEELMSQQLTWPQIFDTLQETIRTDKYKPNPTFVLKECCKQSMRGMTPYYVRQEGRENTEDYTLLGLNTSRERGYEVPGRWYRLDPLKGPVLTGYGPHNIPNYKDAIKEEEEEEYFISSDQINDDGDLNPENLEALRGLNADLFS